MAESSRPCSEWDHLDLGHGFRPTRQGERFTISEAACRTVLASLLKLNHERYGAAVAGRSRKIGEDAEIPGSRYFDGIPRSH
jgi:hypothetical protein